MKPLSIETLEKAYGPVPQWLKFMVGRGKVAIFSLPEKRTLRVGKFNLRKYDSRRYFISECPQSCGSELIKTNYPKEAVQRFYSYCWGKMSGEYMDACHETNMNIKVSVISIMDLFEDDIRRGYIWRAEDVPEPFDSLDRFKLLDL